MVDGVILLVKFIRRRDAPNQFVTGKALALGLRPIVVVNKVDRPDERIQEVLDEVFDLFVSLDATDEQLDFPVLYASSSNGYQIDRPQRTRSMQRRCLKPVVSHVPEPKADVDGDCRHSAGP